MSSLRWGVFVWDADGDMGDGIVLGAFRDDDAAEVKAAQIRRVADGSPVQAMVVPLEPGSSSARRIVEEVQSP
jgi:hypothetical protein